MKIKQTFDNLITSSNRLVGRTSLTIKKNSPEILMGGGIIGGVITIVLACKATLKADEVLDHHKEKMQKIHDAEQYQDEECPYPKEVAGKEKLVVYTQTAFDFAKLYSPAVGVGALSVGCILLSNRIISKRYLGVVAAYNAVSASYKQYRERVRERYGDQADYELRYGVEREKIEETVTDENGKKKTKKSEVEVISSTPSDYVRYWEQYIKNGVLNPNWDPNPEFNIMFLKGVQAEANHLLHGRGYIFLNEVFDMLGFEHTQLGQVVGWYDDGSGDGFVDFGLYNLNYPENRRVINGNEGVIILEFNVDGIIWDKL